MDKRLMRRRLREDFLRFIKSQSILGVAIGIVIGQVFSKFVNSIIEGLVMPIVELFFYDTQWQHITINLGRVHLKIGIIIASMLDFLVVSMVVFLLIKFILKEEDRFIESSNKGGE
jgi:large conductance mechanosensitive channel